MYALCWVVRSASVMTTLSEQEKPAIDSLLRALHNVDFTNAASALICDGNPEARYAIVSAHGPAVEPRAKII